jgi:hypothetical protein
MDNYLREGMNLWMGKMNDPGKNRNYAKLSLYETIEMIDKETRKKDRMNLNLKT